MAKEMSAAYVSSQFYHRPRRVASECRRAAAAAARSRDVSYGDVDRCSVMKVAFMVKCANHDIGAEQRGA